MKLSRRQLTILGLLAAFALLPPLLVRHVPLLLTDYRAGVLTTGLTFAAMALSLNLLVGYAGQISLGHGALVGLGAFSTAIITGRWYLPMGVGLLVAALVGGGFAFLVGLPALRLRGLYLAITTIGFQAVVEQFLMRVPWVSKGSAALPVPPAYAWSFNTSRLGDYLAVVLVILLGLWLLDVNVTRTKLGRAFFAIREDEQVAQSFGIDVTRFKLLAFTLSGALAGVAGALHAHRFGSVTAETYTLEKYSLALLMMVVIGGLGSRVGAVVAAISFTVMPLLFHSLQGWDLLLGAGLLIFAMVRHPGGVAQALQEGREARALRKARDVEEDGAEATLPPLPSLPVPVDRDSNGAAPAATVLEVNDLTVRFGGLVAVNEASIAVPAHRIVGLIGPNGAGKSTLFNAVGGFVPAAAGQVRFKGQDITALAPHARAALGIGRTFQHTGLARNLSVLENLLLAQHGDARYDLGSALAYLPAAARKEDELRARSLDVIAALGFEDKAHDAVRTLSGGQQRIVELACALVTAPELLLLDEPSAGMAPAAVENLAVRLRELRDDLGRTVLLIEHHIPLVMDVCDEVYVLDAGRILAHGTPAEIAAHPEVISAYLGGELQPAPPRRRRRRVAEVAG